jgi:tetratricopeptide (TPR) repeat protein
MAGLEPDAIIFTNGDNDTYPLWYIQIVEGFRPDVNVVNLQLLNTNWYIEQLRDRRPAVPISMTDEEIARVRPMALKGGGVAWKKDLLIQHIIQENAWKRPVYFAVTVPHESWQPYQEYLEMQGMVRRMVPVKKQHQTNKFLLARNFENIFEFRGVLDEDWKRDESTYRSPYTDGMFQNFAVAAMELSRLSAIEKDYEEALKWTELTAQLKPDFDFPDRVLGLYYARTGQVEKGIEHYEKVLEAQPGRGEFWIGLGRIYDENGEPGRALEIFNGAIGAAPDHRDLYANGFYIAAREGRLDEARRFIRAWLQRHPGDKEFRQIDENFESVIYEEFGHGERPDSSLPAVQK